MLCCRALWYWWVCVVRFESLLFWVWVGYGGFVLLLLMVCVLT